MLYGTGRWAHFNVKLHFYEFGTLYTDKKFYTEVYCVHIYIIAHNNFVLPYRRMDAEFVEDVTFPDGSHVQPGTKFVKRWLLMNTGTHAWSANTKVKYNLFRMIPAYFCILYKQKEKTESSVHLYLS